MNLLKTLLFMVLFFVAVGCEDQKLHNEAVLSAGQYTLLEMQDGIIQDVPLRIEKSDMCCVHVSIDGLLYNALAPCSVVPQERVVVRRITLTTNREGILTNQPYIWFVKKHPE